MNELTDRQKQILEQAIRIIAEDGIQNLTIKNLAKAVGVTEAALYRHYDNKHSIMLALTDLFEEFSANNYPGKGLAGIRSFVMDRYKKFSENPELAKVMFSEAIFINNEELSERMRQIMHSHRKEIEVMISEGKKSGEIESELDPKSLFRTVVGSMRLLVTQWCYNGYKFDLKKEGEVLWNNIEIMIKPR